MKQIKIIAEDPFEKIDENKIISIHNIKNTYVVRVIKELDAETWIGKYDPNNEIVIVEKRITDAQEYYTNTIINQSLNHLIIQQVINNTLTFHIVSETDVKTITAEPPLHAVFGIKTIGNSYAILYEHKIVTPTETIELPNKTEFMSLATEAVYKFGKDLMMYTNKGLIKICEEEQHSIHIRKLYSPVVVLATEKIIPFTRLTVSQKVVDRITGEILTETSGTAEILYGQANDNTSLFCVSEEDKPMKIIINHNGEIQEIEQETEKDCIRVHTQDDKVYIFHKENHSDTKTKINVYDPKTRKIEKLGTIETTVYSILHIHKNYVLILSEGKIQKWPIT